MKKRLVSAVLCIAMTAVLMTGCGSKTSASEGQTYIMADVQAVDHPTGKASDYFAQLVSERTDGRITIKVYHGATLGTEAEQVEQIEVGGIDFGRISTSPIANAAYDDLKALQALYLYKDSDQMWRVLQGEVGDELIHASELTDAGIVGLTWFTGGSRNFYNNDHEVHTPSDLEGLTLRVNTDSMTGLLEKVGAIPKNIAYNDILASIQSGDIQGAENNWPSYISTEHYTVAKYITIDEHTSIPEMIVASKATMDSFSAEDQEIIRQCALEATEFQKKGMEEYDAEAIKTAEDAGCVITFLSDDEVAQFQKIGKEINSEVSADYIDIINKIQSVE